MENEIWKDVPGYAGIYQVSNLGRVKSLQRVITRENGWKQTINERFLRQANLNGYKYVRYAKEKEKIIKVICGGIKMKRREISSSGNIGNDGKLRMYFGELNQFFAMHKGSRIIARFIVASPGSSEALKGYYFNYVVPTFRTGIWEAGERLTDEQTERRLRELSPVMYEQIPNIETGEYETRLRKIPELSNAELIEHIEHLKQIAAENYNLYIDDPRSI